MRVCVFASAQLPFDHKTIENAYTLGKLIAEGEHALVFGGVCVGLMGVVANAAKTTSIDTDIVGINHVKFKDFRFAGCTEHIIASTINERMDLYVRYADGFIVLDGGLGTVQELLYIFNQKMYGEHKLPIAVVSENGLFNPEQLFDSTLIDPRTMARYEEMVNYGASVASALTYLVHAHVHKDEDAEKEV